MILRAFAVALPVAVMAAGGAEAAVPAAWERDQAPFRIHGDTYYVGTRGLASLLITSDAGHVLIDGDLPQSAPMIASHIRARSLRCDILITPHPEVSDFWGRLARREQGEADALVDGGACGRLADAARQQLDARVDAERTGHVP